MNVNIVIFTVRHYASTVYAIVMCLSHSGIVWKQLNRESCKQSQTIAQGLKFFDAKDRGEIGMDHPLQGRQMQVG